MKMNRSARLGSGLVALALCLCLAVAALAAPLDYTMAYKLYRQLASGSGFSGTLEVALCANESVDGDALVTEKPFQMAWDYIYVRPTATTTAEHRLDATLMDEETPVTEAHFQLQDGVLSAQTPLLGDDWYQLAVEKLFHAKPDSGDAQGEQLPAFAAQALAATGMPGLIKMALPLCLRLNGFSNESQRERLEGVLEKMSLRMDLWIEGYRQNAQLGRMEDGSAIITVSYQVPAANIKAQTMQMVLDLLSDEASRQSLADYVDDNTAALLLNPEYQPYYFAAIEALPIAGELNLTRTVDMRGDTVALHLALPFYDSEGGAVTFCYDRQRGEGDLPDTNTLTMESGDRTTEMTYLTYRSMTDVTVYQGTFKMTDQSVESFAVQPEGKTAFLPDVAFTLSRQTAEAREDGDLNVYTDNWQLKLEPNPNGEDPEAFLPLEVAVDSRFASKTPQTSATDVEVVVTISGEERPQAIQLQFEGLTRRQWQAEELPKERTDVFALTGEERQQLVSEMLANGAPLVQLFLSSTVPGDAAAEADEQPEAQTGAEAETAAETTYETAEGAAEDGATEAETEPEVQTEPEAETTPADGEATAENAADEPAAE